MNEELADYIIAYYPELLSLKERAAQHLFATGKAKSFKSEAMKNKILDDLGTKDQEVL